MTLLVVTGDATEHMAGQPDDGRNAFSLRCRLRQVERIGRRTGRPR